MEINFMNPTVVPMQFAAELTGMEIQLYHAGKEVEVHGLPLVFSNPVSLDAGMSAIFAWVKGDPARTATFSIRQTDGELLLWGELKIATDETQDTGDFKYYTPYLQG